MKIRYGLIWSTFFLLLGIALIAPTTKSYGQLIAQESLLSKRNSEIVPFESSYVEEELYLESWMMVPFESVNIDEDLTVESWMTSIWF